MVLKQLPLGDRDFVGIVDLNFLYADKTKFIYDLINGPSNSYFLSRPRRFGKTLLLHTLNELFTGNRKRFKGLWIDDSNYDFPKHPVIPLTLTMDASNTELLKANIINELKAIAKKEEVDVYGLTPDMYFGELITALHDKFNTKVVVLIDEYDAPVSNYISNLELAEANAKILHNLFASLKKLNVSPCLHFTLVTGITRYALNSTDSGPNHLTDISLDPRYAGICGFTLEEFDSLFSDRMEETLSSLIKSGTLKSSDTIEDLKIQIFKWYNGYNWGEPTRVLNPYSILNFFSSKHFDNFWIQSGRPNHLTALIRKRPLDFLAPRLKSYLSEELRKTDLSGLSPVHALFHSGYLTVDEITNISRQPSDSLITATLDAYSFKLPNYEVSSSYYADCFVIIFNLANAEQLKERGAELKKAILSRDSEVLSAIVKNSISTLSCYQKPKSEKDFRAIIHVLLFGMGFKVRSEDVGSTGRLDLCLELEDKVFVVIELKYCPAKIKLSKAKENEILSSSASKLFKREQLFQILSELAYKKLNPLEIMRIRFNDNPDDSNSSEKRVNQELTDAVIKKLPRDVIDSALAESFRKHFTSSQIEDEILATNPKPDHTKDQIDAILTHACKKALNDISEKKYHSPLKMEAKAFIDIGISIYGYGTEVMALFGPDDN
ncbi:MAG: AAA family ATPase [Deltaproteobacteria bacterium]|jgi:hypothetical protein|nr:AAA family ATPase [Deltaproteobacteria bacterium]